MANSSSSPTGPSRAKPSSSSTKSAEFSTEDTFEGGARIGYSHDGGKWEVALFGRNITDEENVKGAIDFNNLTGFDNEPRIVGASFKARF